MTTSTKPYSNQRAWQLKQLAAGRCILCGKKARIRKFCRRHQVEDNARRRALYHRRKNGGTS